MATHELYVGGPARSGISRSMYPAPAFDNTLDVFKKMPLAEHKATIIAALTRTLAFGSIGPNGLASSTPNDSALMDYVNNNVIAQGDVLDIQVIPANTLLLGLYANVEAVAAGLSITLSLDDGTTLGAAIDCSAAFNKMVAPGGSWVSAGAVSLATANFSNVPRMLKATLTALGVGKFGQFRGSFSPILIQLQEGQF